MSKRSRVRLLRVFAISAAVLLCAPAFVLPAAAQGGFGISASPAASSEAWTHPEGYFQITLPAGFSKLNTDAGHAFTIFGPPDANELLIVVNVPGAGLPLEVVAAHVPDLLQLIGPFWMISGFRADSAGGSGVYSADAMTPNGAFARTYLKPSGHMTLVAIAVAVSQQEFQRRASTYAPAVQSLRSSYQITDATGGRREILGSWEQTSTTTTGDLYFLGGRKTYTFYGDGTVQRHSVTMASFPGVGGGETEQTTWGNFIVLGDVVFFYWYTDEGISIEVMELNFNMSQMFLDGVPHRRAGF